MATSKEKKETISKFNKENYVNVTFRLRKKLDGTLIECLNKRESKNTLIREAVCNEILKYECSSINVYEELIDLREKLRIALIICKGFCEIEILEVLLNFYNNGVISTDGLNILLNEFDYQYVKDFDKPGYKQEKTEGYDADQILDKLDLKIDELAKHGYNNSDILSALYWLLDYGYIDEDEALDLGYKITRIKNLDIEYLKWNRRYYNYGAFEFKKKGNRNATVRGIIHIDKYDDLFE